jgi:competence protein ComEC
MNADMLENSASHSPRYQPLVVIALSVAAGIALDRSSDMVVTSGGFARWWFVAVSFLAAWWCAWHHARTAIAAMLLLVSTAMLGAAWHNLQWNFFPNHDAGRYANLETTPACVTAVVLAAPELLPAPRPTPLRAIPSGERSQVELRLTGIRDGADWLSVAGRCRLVVNGDLLAVAPGDRVQVFGQLRRPSPPMNPGEHDFAADARAERRLASLIASSPDCVAVTVYGSSSEWWPERIVAAVRQSGKQLLRTYVGPERSGLAAAILLGDREALPSHAIQPFFLTGTVHLLVVSGLNVAILAAGLYVAMRFGWLPRRVALALIMAIVAAYTLVTGAEPPVLRAAVLVVVVCLAAWSGRRTAPFNSLAAATLVVLAINPSELFRTGTQLSFLCVAVLVWVGHWQGIPWRFQVDQLDRLIAASRPWYAKVWFEISRWTLLLMLTSGVVWLATTPIVLYCFHVVSPVALLISPVVWLIALVAMWAGFITLLCGWIVPFVAVVAGWVCSVSLGWLVQVVDWAESLPGSHFWAPGPALWWVLGFYMGLVAIMLWGRKLVPTRFQVALACLWILVGLVPPLARHWTRGDELRCTFLAMGHGTCVVLETPNGKTFLYDAGSLGSPDFATQSIAGYLWQRGILRVDGIILSHADVDHYNAVPGLLERFHVGAVYVSPMMFDWYGATGPDEAPNVLHNAIDAAGVPIHEIWAGDRLHVGDVSIDVFHPPHDGVVGSDNANSITLAVEYAGRRLLLPGDLETPGLDDVVAELPYDCDLLMAPHHGSRRSDPPGFAAWSTPEWVVVSGGADSDAEVVRTYAASGAKVLNTGKLGAIDFSIGRDGIAVDSFREIAAQ